MNILIISQYFYPENFKINDLALELQQRGHTVSVLTGIPNYPAGKWFEGYGLRSIGSENWNGIRIMRVPLLPRFSGKGIQLALNYLSFAYSASLMGPLLCRSRQDMIFVYEPSPFTVGIPAIIMRYIKSAPLIFWVQDLWPESLSATGAVKSSFVLDLVGLMVKKIYESCDYVLVQSRAFIEPAISAGATKDKISYFPNWAEDYYRPITPPVDGLDLPDGFKIIFAGNMGAAQSLETIVTAIEKLRDQENISWIMIGDGRRRQWMEDRIKSLGLQRRVTFTGRLPAEKMPGYFSHADGLLATLTDSEIFSYTIPGRIQTYMACGRPLVVALNGEGGKVVRESGAGYAVPAGDGIALADAVLKLFLLSESERDRMGRAARLYSEENFNKNHLITGLEDIIHGVHEKNICAS